MLRGALPFEFPGRNFNPPLPGKEFNLSAQMSPLSREPDETSSFKKPALSLFISFSALTPRIRQPVLPDLCSSCSVPRARQEKPAKKPKSTSLLLGFQTGSCWLCYFQVFLKIWEGSDYCTPVPVRKKPIWCWIFQVFFRMNI